MIRSFKIVPCRLGGELVHPGRILAQIWMEPYGISQNSLARRIGVSPRRVNEIVQGKRSITADTAIRLAAVFWTGEHYWMGLQSDYDIERAREAQMRSGSFLGAIEPDPPLEGWSRAGDPAPAIHPDGVYDW